MNTFENRLINSINESGQADKFYALVVLCDGVFSRHDFHIGNQAHDSYSVSKSVIAMGMGILYDRGLIRLSDNLGSLLDGLFPVNAWRDITLEQLLSHRTGAADGVDFDLTHAGDWQDPEWLHTLFACPITGVPGKDFVYSDGNYYIAGRIIEKLTGMDADRFIQREIFSLLGFHQNAWSRDCVGHTLGGTGLYMRTDDMAKLGLLCLSDGKWNGKQIFSKEWSGLMRGNPENGNAYGFGVPCLQNGGFCPCGMYGQGYYFNPRTGNVCAWHSYNTDGLYAACEQLDR